MSMPSKKFIAIGLIGALIGGCASFDEINKSINSSNSNAESAMSQQNQMRKSGAVVRMSGAKLAGQEVSVKSTSQLPSAFNRPFSYLSAHQPLSAVLGEIGRRTGIATAVQPADTSNASGSAAASAAAPSQQALAGMPNFAGGADTPIAVDWNGDLKGLLDYLASATRMYWKFEDGRIYFFKMETRTFHVFLPGGKRTVKSAIALAGSSNSSTSGSGASGSGGSPGGSGGSTTTNGGTVDVSSSIDIDAYDAIVKSIQAMVSTAEGVQAPAPATTTAANATVISSRSVAANPALGLVTVTSTPAILDRVASYIRGVNERFAQNVMIGVKVYNLTVNKNVNAGASLRAAYREVAGRYGVTLSGPSQLSPANDLVAGSLVVNGLSGSSEWSGSQLLLQALEQVGNVQYVTSGQVIAANGQPSPLQIATEFSYVSERIPPTITSGTVVPGKVTSTIRSVGFTANFLPLILGDNRIMLQYQINLSSLLSLDTFGVGDNAIQIPKVATQSLQQQAFLKDGQSIVLLGFEQERAQTDNLAGVSGMSKNAGSVRNLMVIVMEVFSGK